MPTGSKVKDYEYAFQLIFDFLCGWMSLNTFSCLTYATNKQSINLMTYISNFLYKYTLIVSMFNLQVQDITMSIHVLSVPTTTVQDYNQIISVHHVLLAITVLVKD